MSFALRNLDFILLQTLTMLVKDERYGFLDKFNLMFADSPFLLGRCLWMASRFATAMSQELTQR